MRGNVVRSWFVVVLMLAGCSGKIEVTFGPDEDAGSIGNGSITIESPSEDSIHPRDQIGTDGTFVAPIAFSAQASSEIERIDWLAEGTFALGSGSPPDFALTYEYHGDGARWVEAVGFDGDGNEVARAQVSFEVTPPPPSDCEGMLAASGVTFDPGPDSDGVPTPVTVTLPIAGIGYRYISNTTQRGTWMMDCELALALRQAAEIFAARDVVEIADYGIYNYRCIDQSVDPPDCPGSTLSMHAYAQAIDIAGVTTSDGTYYSVNDDWVIDPDTEDTCAAATEPGKDAFLHELICALHGASVFNIYLTPNYNSSHRNHFHVDLTSGSDFIEKRGAHDRGGSEQLFAVDEGPDDL